MARDFNGTSQYGTATIAGLVTRFSAACWVNLDAFSSYTPLVNSRTDTFQALLLAGSAGNPVGYGWENTSDEFDVASGLFVSTGVWTLVGVTITPTAATLYRRETGGALESFTNTKTHNGKNPADWYFGYDFGIATRLNGRLAEVGMWNTDLSLADWQLLAAGVRALDVKPYWLMEYWNLLGNNSPEVGLKGISMSLVDSPPQATHPPMGSYRRTSTGSLTKGLVCP
jgi:hypothetical protein